MPVLDSSFIIDLIRKKEEALQKLSELEDEYSSISTTEINILELYRGAYLSTKIHQNLEQVKDILKGFHIIELDESIYEVYASLSANLISKGNPIGSFDGLIAAIALCHNEKIVTRDKHFKEISQLDVIVY